MTKFSMIKKKTAQVWQLIAPYWRSEEKYKAWSILFLIIALNLAYVYMMVQLNEWSGAFYDAIQKLDKNTFISQCYVFLFLVLIVVPIFITNNYLTSLLGFNWRKWLTKQYLNRWVKDSLFYRLSFQAYKTDNPDQRIAQDLSAFSTGFLTIALTFFRETVNLFSFAVILWSLSGPLSISLASLNITIPGYMVFAALLYAIAGTYGIYRIGKPLFRLDFEQERLEANFRYQLVRLRERAEEVAIYHGEKMESVTFRQSFTAIYENFKKIIYRNLYVNTWQNFYNNVATIFPILVMAPKFFSGAITFGVLMQIARAFSSVIESLAVIILNFNQIASLIATTNRLLGFAANMEELESDLVAPKPPRVEVELHYEDAIVIENLQLKTPEKQNLMERLNLTVKKGERVLIMGRSGLGKSTLLRAIAGLWPFGEGKIKLPATTKPFLVPQRAYMPLGTLRHSLLYPNYEQEVSKTFILEVLAACRLEHLAFELDEVKDWSMQLSVGEQQRIIFARAIIQKPEWLIMDEPTASMDKETEKLVFTALQRYLPNSSIITIGHGVSLKAFHNKVLELDAVEEIENLEEAQSLA